MRMPCRLTLRNLFRSAALLIGFYTVGGFLLLPLIAKPILVSQLGQALRRPVAIERLSLNPFTLRLRIAKLEVKDHLPGLPLLAVDQIIADFQLISIIKGGPVLREVSLSAPRLAITRIQDNFYNFSDLLAGQGQGDKAATARPLRFSLANLTLRQGRVEFSDLPKGQRQVLEQLDITIPFLSNLEHSVEVFVTPAVSGVLNGAALSLAGQAQPFHLAADNQLALSIKDLDVAHYAPYVPQALGLKVLAGRAAGDWQLAFRRDAAGCGKLALSGRLALDGLELAEANGEPLLTLPSLTVSLAPSRVLEGEVHVTELAMQRPVLNLRRNADQTLNLDPLRPAPPAGQSAVPPAGQSVGQVNMDAPPVGPPGCPVLARPELLLQVDRFVLTAGKVVVDDQAVRGGFKTVLEPIDLAVTGLSTKDEGKADFSLTVKTDADETLSLGGASTLKPLLGDGRLTLGALQPARYRPYFASLLDFELSSARLELDTAFHLGESGGKPALTWRELSLGLFDLAARRGKEEPFLVLPALRLEGGTVDMAGRKVVLPRVKSKGARLTFQRLADGSIDLATLIRPPKAAPADDRAAAPGWDFDLESFEADDYGLAFTDLAAPKALSLRLGQLALRGQGLKGRTQGLTLERLGLDLKDISARQDKSEPFLSVPSLEVEGLAIDQPARKIGIAQLKSQGGQLAAKRQKNGSLDLGALLSAAGQGKDKPVKNKPVKKAGKAKKTEKIEPAEKEKKKEADPAWDLRLGQLAINDYTVAFEDHATPRPLQLKLSKLDFSARDFHSRATDMFQVDAAFALAERGRVTLTGKLGREPLHAELDLALKNIPVARFEPYWANHLKLTVRKGDFSSQGQLLFRAGKGGAAPTFSYTGSGALVNVSALDTRKDNVLDWKSLTIDGLAVKNNPMRLKMKDIGLTDYRVALIITKEGNLNLRELMGQPAEPVEAKGPEPPSPAKAAGSVEIGRLTLQGGEIEFTDNHITPQFATQLVEVTGRVSGLSSDPSTKAEVDLFGKLANRAPINITGTVNPLAEELFVDLKASVKEVDLSSLTPYSGKYVGYTIRMGKLFLDTAYSIVGSKIDSQHAILLDQFTLGDQVESEQAIKAPVRLAIALLKNRKGEIHLDLPVSGDLSHPEFQLGTIISRMIISLLTKAITAPFALLGALFSGEEMSSVDFAAGSPALLPDTMKKLEALAQTVNDRPGVSLEIKGYAALDKDHEALIQQRFSERLFAGQEGRPAAGQAAEALAALPAADLERRLKKAYQEADFPKPRNVLGLVKSLESEEMQKLLLSHIEVNDNDLRALAEARAKAVWDYLQGAGQVNPQQLLRAEPGIDPAKGEDKLSGSRVDFSLK